MNTSYQRGAKTTDEWYTPRELVENLGKFDLDPYAPSRKWYTARECYTKEDDGLAQEWHGRVFLNPPYSRPLVGLFIERMARHGNGIALIFNRMDIAMWHDVIFPTADAMLVMRGRVRFVGSDGLQAQGAGCGSVLVGWGVQRKSA